MSGIFSCFLASIIGQGLSLCLLKMAIEPGVFLNTVLMCCLLTPAVNTQRNQLDGNDRVQTSDTALHLHCQATLSIPSIPAKVCLS